VIAIGSLTPVAVAAAVAFISPSPHVPPPKQPVPPHPAFPPLINIPNPLTIIPILFQLTIANQAAKTESVVGIVTAQYTQKRLLITVGWSQRSDGIENSAAQNVAGRNPIVITAIVFMLVLSCCVAVAMLMVACASCRARRLKICVGRRVREIR